MYKVVFLNVISLFLLPCRGHGHPVEIEAAGIGRKPYENPTLMEGDMLFPKASAPTARGVAGRGASVPWTNGIVPYEILPGYVNDHRNNAKMERMIAMNNSKCIQFREKISTDRYYISITNGVGCSSYVGQNTGVNMTRAVTLQHPGCIYEGIIMHELLHALGFFHEQSRSDRDNYVKVNYVNIQSGMEHNFAKYNNTIVDTLNTSYDLLSLMHYESTAFSANGFPTIEPLVPNSRMGQRDNMSDTDILEVRLLYNCTANGVTLPPTPWTTTVILDVETTISSEWTRTNRKYARYGAFESSYYYERYRIIVPQTGSYILTTNSSLDTYGSFYSSPFNPWSPRSNLLAFDDDSGVNQQFEMQMHLRANSVYELVVTTSYPSVTGSYIIIILGLNSPSIEKVYESPMRNDAVRMTIPFSNKFYSSVIFLMVGHRIRTSTSD